MQVGAWIMHFSIYYNFNLKSQNLSKCSIFSLFGFDAMVFVYACMHFTFISIPVQNVKPLQLLLFFFNNIIVIVVGFVIIVVIVDLKIKQMQMTKKQKYPKDLCFYILI